MQKKLVANPDLQAWSICSIKDPQNDPQEVFFVPSNVAQANIDKFLGILYKQQFVRKVKRPQVGFCVKDELDKTFQIDDNFLDRARDRFEMHCFQHPDKGPIMKLLGFTSSLFKKFLRKQIKFSLTNPDMCACIVEGAELRYFVYEGEFEGTILNNDAALPRYYWFGFLQKRLTWSLYRNPKTTLSKDEEDQILNVIILREASLTIEQKRANGETITAQREKKIKIGIRAKMEQLRTSTPSLSSLCMQSEQVKSDLLSIDLWLKRCFWMS